MKCPDVCVHCWRSKHVPIVKDAFGKKNTPILKVSSAHFISIICMEYYQLKCIFTKSIHNSSPFPFNMLIVPHSHCLSMILYINSINSNPYCVTQQILHLF